MKFKSIFSTIFLSLLFMIGAYAQSPTTIKQKCPNVSTYAQVQITGLGDINVNPCTGRTTTFTQNVVLPSGVVITSLKLADGTAASPSLAFVSDTDTGIYRAATNTFGIATNGVANTTFAPSANTFRSAIHSFTNVAGTSQFGFIITFSGANQGYATLGDCVTSASDCLIVDNISHVSRLAADLVTVGDANTVLNSTVLNVNDTAKTIGTAGTGNLVIWDDSATNNHKLQRTITAAGTTGNQTINKQAGTVNIAAAGTSIVITNNTVTTSSLVTATLRTADTTCTFIKSVVPTANTITITVNAGCNAETSVGFIVWN